MASADKLQQSVVRLAEFLAQSGQVCQRLRGIAADDLVPCSQALG